MTAPFNDRPHARAHVKPITNGDVMMCHAWRVILLIPVLTRISPWSASAPLRPFAAPPRIADQQSRSLLAAGSITVDLTHVLPISDGHLPRWECHGKIDRDRNAWSLAKWLEIVDQEDPAAGVGGGKNRRSLIPRPATSLHRGALQRSSLSFRVAVSRS